MLEVLYEDNHLLAVNKPALLPTMGVAADRPSLLASAKEYLRTKYQKPGNVYLGIVSRLDAPVTGVVLLARTSKAAARLSRQFREREVKKRYLAIVDGEVEPAEGELVHYLRKDERHRRMHVTSENSPDAQRAELTYRTVSSARDKEATKYAEKDSPSRGSAASLFFSCSPSLRRFTLLEIGLLTGRKHQIRVQLAKAGWPVVGDRKYGSDVVFGSGIALHAWQLEFLHPVRRTMLSIEAPLPKAWMK
jgi:23S rRNA pseudouridine1911/1915/1917 synthase